MNAMSDGAKLLTQSLVNQITNTTAATLAQQNIPLNYNTSRMIWTQNFNESFAAMFPNKYAFDQVLSTTAWRASNPMMDPYDQSSWIYPNFAVKYSPMSLKDEFDSISPDLAEQCTHIDYDQWIDEHYEESDLWIKAHQSVFNKGWGCYQCKGMTTALFYHTTTYGYSYLKTPGFETIPNEYQMRNDSIYLQRHC